MSACAPAAELDEHLDLDLDQLYAAYAASHLDLAWAEFVLDHVVEHRDELIDAIHDDDERAQRVLEWLRRMPDRR